MAEPVTLDELKANTRVDADDADLRLATLLEVARDNVERVTESTKSHVVSRDA